MKKYTLNGVGLYRGSYWFPKDYRQVKSSTSKGTQVRVWPDGDPVKDWMTQEEKLQDYKKRFDDLMSKPYGPAVFKRYRETIGLFPKKDGRALFVGEYETYVRPYYVQEVKKHTNIQNQITQQQKTQQEVAFRENKKLVLENQINTNNTKTYLLAGAATVSIISVGWWLLTRK